MRDRRAGVVPKAWSREEVERDVVDARSWFQRRRLEEPRERYEEFFMTFQSAFASLIDDTVPRLAAGTLAADELARLAASDQSLTALRYLTAPPISKDDLSTLADTLLSPAALRREPTTAQRIRKLLLHFIDPHRFPWVAQARDPRANERDTAIIASAAMVAARRVETRRRMDAMKDQEQSVKACLSAGGMTEVKSRRIRHLSDAPSPREFCAEAMLGEEKADIVAVLADRRVVPIECKVSNSAVNSVKRLNREAAGKASSWLRQFGHSQTIPAAVLAGVFKVDNVLTAQRSGLSIFWAHRLDDLKAFVRTAR